MASYMVKLLQAFKDLSETHEMVTRAQLVEKSGIEFKERQLESALANFRRSAYGLFTDIDKDYMQLDKERIKEIHKRYHDGEIKLWYSPNGIECKKRVVTKRELTLISKRDMAKYVIYKHSLVSKEPLTAREYLELSRKYSFGLSNKDIGNAIHQYKKWYDITGENKEIKYYPKQSFFDDNEKIFYKIDDFIKHGNKVKKPFMYGTVFLGILSAYRKPLTLKNIITIAEKHGFNLNEKSLANIPARACKKYLISDVRIGKAIGYQLNDKFFEDKGAGELIAQLPGLADKIKSRFNQQVGRIEEPNEPGHEQSATVIEKQVEPQKIEVQTETVDSVEIKTDDQQSDEFIEAANIGASIIAYINKLKRRNKESDQTELEALQEKFDDRCQTVLNQRNAINSLEMQVEKFRKVIENQNEQIKNLTHYLSNARLEIEELKNRMLPTGFRMGEVARIKNFIKG